MNHSINRFARVCRVLLREFRILIIATVCAFAVSTLILYFVYPKEELPRHHHSLMGAAYDTLLMTFFAQPIPFVDDWRLVPLFFGLPLLGLLIIAEGVVHLGNLIFQHRRYTREWQEMLASVFENHIVVCGLGNVGFRIVQQLRKLGEEVVCIELNRDNSFIAEMEKYDVPVIVGDAKNDQLLGKANITHAKALIAATDDDLANLETCLSVMEIAPKVRVVMRMFDQRLAQKVQRAFGINVFSASALSAPVFAQAALSSDILSSFEFSGNTINAVQIQVEGGGKLHGLTVGDVTNRFQATILMHERNGAISWNPPADTLLHAGAKLLVMSDHARLQEILCAKQ